MGVVGRRRRVGAALLALLGLTSGALIFPIAPASAEEPVRILIVGNSVSQGSAGDWTWRYRLWQHLRDDGVAVDLVGPRNDLWDNLTATPGSQDYLEPDFDTDHAARWGMSFADLDQPVGELIADYQPDVVIEMLGVNDLAYQGIGPENLHDRVTTFVEDARAADPGIDLVLGRVAQTWLTDVPAANTRISDIPQELGTENSRIVVANTDAGFRERADTWDLVHPDAAGEIKIAAAVSDALARLGVGSPYPRPLPVVPLGPRWAPRLAVRAGDRSATLTWSGSPGSDHEYIWRRDVTVGERWRRLPTPVEGERLTLAGLTNRRVYAFRLQPVKGYHAAAPDVRSNVVRVTPKAPAPGPVGALSTTPAAHALEVRWSTADRATGYRVSWWPADDTSRVSRTGVDGTRVRIDALMAGRRYVVRVRAMNDGTFGPASRASGVPTGPRPAAPDGFSARQVSLRRVRLVWEPSRSATRYQVQVRRLDGSPWATLGWRSRTAFTTTSMMRGQTRSYRVRAWHQYLAGGVTGRRVVRIR